MKKRVLSALVMIAAVIGAFSFRLIPIYGVYVFDLLIGALAIVSALEMVKLLDGMKINNSPMAIGVYPSLMFAGHMFFFLFNLEFYWWVVIQASILVFMFLVTFISYLFDTKYLIRLRKQTNLSKGKLAIKTALGSLIAFIYPTILFAAFMMIDRVDELTFGFVEHFAGNLGWLMLVCAVIIPVISDTSAYFCGKFFKGPKLCSKISPKKTVAGSAFALLFTGLIMGALYYLFNVFTVFNTGMAATHIYMWHFIILGLLGSVVSQLGDLFESYLKRKANVKDSGTIFPGHGGFLDRIDSHIFSAVFTLVYFAMIFIIY